jgi:hypothetical protein
VASDIERNFDCFIDNLENKSAASTTGGNFDEIQRLDENSFLKPPRASVVRQSSRGVDASSQRSTSNYQSIMSSIVALVV